MEGLTKGTHVSKVVHSIETPQLIASCTILHPAQYNGYEHYHNNAHFSFVLSGGCREKKAKLLHPTTGINNMVRSV
ncbi:hypothetical protein HK413_06280 [Mucilaginibacter sp. S1162]|uniref:Uncharacterized protein n=1 Tax=Mucilaginibacter humi TaxID=2732510 RepID=A0ABX1W156_9SPHI|nr:hypothetical protein [Mucilaginibacter humi]